MTYSQREFDRHMTLVPKLFNVQSTTEEGGGAPVQKDMFGTITTPRPLPDDRDEEWERRKRGSMTSRIPRPRRENKLSEKDRWMPMSARVRPTSAKVVMLPELRNLSTPRAISISLEATPDLVKSYVGAGVAEFLGTGDWPDQIQAAFPHRPENTVRELRCVNPSRAVIEEIIHQPGTTLMSSAHGILPPDMARHEARTRKDRVFTYRQHFPLRSSDPRGGAKGDKEGRDAGGGGGGGGVSSRPTTGARSEGGQREDSLGSRPNSGAPAAVQTPRPPPPRPPPVDLPVGGEGTRVGPKAIRRHVKAKIFDLKHEVDSKGNFTPRSRAKRLAVPERKNPVVDKVDFVKDNTKHDNLVFDARLEARAEQFAVREERIALARQKREELEEELAKKSSEEKRAEHVEELKRAEAEANRRHAREGWLGMLVHLAVTTACVAAKTEFRQREVARIRRVTSAKKMQKWYRTHIAVRNFHQETSQRKHALAKLSKALSPSVIRWKIRRKQKKADIIHTFMQEMRNNSLVQERLSSFLRQMRRLQRAWRNHLRRERARMMLLSKQWDKAFMLIRSGGKYGRIGKTIITPQSPAKALKNGPPSPAKGRGGALDASAAHVGHLQRGDSKRKKEGGAKGGGMASSSSTHDHASSAHALGEASKSAQRRSEGAMVMALATTQQQMSGAGGSSGHGNRRRGGILAVSQNAYREFEEWVKNADERVQTHNRLHVVLTKRQSGLVGKLASFPEIKWRLLSLELKRLKAEHVLRLAQYVKAQAEYESFLEQKQVVQQVMMSFAGDSDAEDALSNRLLGNMLDRKAPVAPRFHPMFPAKVVQEHIYNGMQHLLSNFSRMSSGGAGAEGSEATEDNNSDEVEVEAQIWKPVGGASGRKPWWILHESYAPAAVKPKILSAPPPISSPTSPI